MCFYIKDIPLDFVSDSISGLPYIFYVVAPVAFQTINEIVALEGAIPDGIIGFFFFLFLFCKFLIYSDREILLQNLQCFLQVFNVPRLGYSTLIFAGQLVSCRY